MFVAQFAAQVRGALAAPPVRRAVRVLWVVSIGLVVVLSLIPDAAPGGPPGIDKLWHALAYLALGFGGAFGQTGPGRYKPVWAMIALGWAIEGAQALLPWRSAEWPTDWSTPWRPWPAARSRSRSPVWRSPRRRQLRRRAGRTYDFPIQISGMLERKDVYYR